MVQGENSSIRIILMISYSHDNCLVCLSLCIVDFSIEYILSRSPRKHGTNSDSTPTDGLESTRLSSTFNITSILSSSSSAKRHTSAYSSIFTDQVQGTILSQTGFGSKLFNSLVHSVNSFVLKNSQTLPHSSTSQLIESQSSSIFGVSSTDLCLLQDGRIQPSKPYLRALNVSVNRLEVGDRKGEGEEQQSERNSLRCRFCGKSYRKRCSLISHEKSHNPIYLCPYCQKAFSRKWLLSCHERLHTKEKPYVCDTCGRAFADPSNRRAHLQTHMARRRHACDTCSRTFSRRSQLSKHLTKCQHSCSPTK